jgi:hypothetical protein
VARFGLHSPQKVEDNKDIIFSHDVNFDGSEAKKRCSKDIRNGRERRVSSMLSDDFIVFLPFPGGYITPLPFGIFPPVFFVLAVLIPTHFFFCFVSFPAQSTHGYNTHAFDGFLPKFFR